MITGWSIRRRLVLIAVGVSVAILVVVALITVNSTGPIIAAQTEAALIARNQTFASTLDGDLRMFSASVETLAAAVGTGRVQELEMLLSQASNLLARNPSIQRIGALMPADGGYEVLLFSPPRTTGSLALLSRQFGAAIPDDNWIEQAWEVPETYWFGPHIAYNAEGEVVSVTTPVRQRSGDRIGLLWLDIPLDTLRGNLDDLLRLENPFGYNLLVDSNDRVLAAHALPSNVNTGDDPIATLRSRTDLRQMLGAVERDANGLIASGDPLNARLDSYIIRSSLPSSGWSIVSVLPTALFVTPLVQTSFQVLMIALLGILVLGILLYGVAKSSVSEPLTSLAFAAQEIGSGDMRYIIGYQERGDEIGNLARALEDMKTDLAQSYEELSLWSRRLERRVQERTIELDAAQKDAQRRAGELQAVYDASLSVVSEYYLKIMLQKLAERAENLLGAQYVSVWLVTDDRERLQMVATTSEDRSHIDQTVTLDQGIGGQAVREQRPIVVDDYPNWPHRLGWTASTVYHAISVPLLLSQQPVGALFVGRSQSDPTFDDNDQRLLSLLANLASPMVRNAQLYAQVDAAQKQAESANRVKTRFLASVTHELRTPLNLVINNMDFMRVGMFGEVNDEQHSRLDQTIRSAEHLLYLINDLLDVSKIEAGEMQMFFQPTDLYPVLEDTIDSTLALLDGTKPLSLHADIPEGLPQLTVDARRVRQVLLNLLSNAVKFTQEGEVRLAVRAHNDSVEFIVTDSGIGIPSDELDLIFEAFERSKPSRQMGIEGTGLGLPISRFLVEAHGGTMRVQSEVDKGSTFTVTLPLEPPQEMDKPRTAAFIGQGD
jgi:signal transduction histidine kinase/HAMP domain-containing protein